MQLPTEIFGYEIPWNNIFVLRDTFWQMATENKDFLMLLGVGILVGILALFLIREFATWFSKQNRIIYGQKISNALLNEQNDLLAENNNLLTTLISETTTLRQELARANKKEIKADEPVVKKVPPKPKTTRATSKTTKNPTE